MNVRGLGAPHNPEAHLPGVHVPGLFVPPAAAEGPLDSEALGCATGQPAC